MWQALLSLLGKGRPGLNLKDTSQQSTSGTAGTNPAAGGSLFERIFGIGAQHPAGATTANPADTATTNTAVNTGGFNMASTPESQKAFTDLLGAQKDVATKQAASIPSSGKSGLTSVLGSLASSAGSHQATPLTIAPVSQPQSQQQGAPAPSFLNLLQSLLQPAMGAGSGSGGSGLGVPGQPGYESEEDRKRRGYGPSGYGGIRG